MMTYYRKAWDIIGYTYHADIYCRACGDKLPPIDPEGNDRHPVFVCDELDYDYNGETITYSCGECGLPSAEW